MKTVFIRAIEAPVDHKAAVLREAARGPTPARFETESRSFAVVPTSPFSYWVSETIRRIFVDLPRFEADGRSVKQGLATADDFRFVRLYWEVSPKGLTREWRAFAKGGAFSPVYADVPLVLEWRGNGSILKAKVIAEHGNAGKRIYNEDFFGRSGLTWPLRSQRGFGIRAMSAGCIFGHKGPAAFVDDDDRDELLALLAVATSAAFRALVGLQMAFGSYEVGVIQRTPVPRFNATDITTLANLARRAWSLNRSLDTSNETSHAFVLPAAVSRVDRDAVERESATIQKQIDDEAFRLYGIGAGDRLAIDSSGATAIHDGGDNTAEADEDADKLDDEKAASGAVASAPFASWLVGVAFCRFDPRLVTGERAVPPEPEPFDPLPSRSPAMYPHDEEPGDRPDILVDDEGHADDLAARTTAVAERVKVDTPENLRTWFAKEFFPLHIKMYSKSRRKAPIYWQLSTPSASYAVWLYIHAFGNDTLFRVQNDYVAPKLAHEERRLESLKSELRDGATAAQRKALGAQEAVVDELRAFLQEVKRVAPLWKPSLDDGVIINFAPLWRLVPQNKSWQKELKSNWDALAQGEYDWAHLSMHLWPERVVPKCAKDRSLAIVHGLEDVFWVEGTDGKWTARKTPTKSVEELVKQRTSPAVKSALKSLLEAPVASGKSTGRNSGRRKAVADEGDA